MLVRTRAPQLVGACAKPTSHIAGTHDLMEFEQSPEARVETQRKIPIYFDMHLPAPCPDVCVTVGVSRQIPHPQTRSRYARVALAGRARSNKQTIPAL